MEELILDAEKQKENTIFQKNKVYMNNKRIYSLKELGDFVLNIDDNGNGHNIYLNPISGNGKIYINLIGKNNNFYIGKNNIVMNDINVLYWGCSPNILPNNVSVEIGDNNFFNGELIKIISPIEKHRKIKIGNYNLFGGYITFRGRNDHIIYDIKSNSRINMDHDIILGNNIWVCDSVTFLTKTNIKGNAIIAEKSLVNKEFNEKNILIAGIPASIKKKEVMWHRNLDSSFVDSDNPLN